MHLTNVAIQKSSSTYNSDTGGKWDIQDLKMYLLARHGREIADKMFQDVQAIVIHSLLAVQPVMINDKHCFELYGYDIMFDDKFKPWLIEVNASPSLSANTKADYNMKTDMLNDMLDIVDMEKRLTGDEEQVGGFDLIYCNGQALQDPQSVYSSFIGCAVPSQGSTPKSQKTIIRRGSVAAEALEKNKAQSSRGLKAGQGSGGYGGTRRNSTRTSMRDSDPGSSSSSDVKAGAAGAAFRKSRAHADVHSKVDSGQSRRRRKTRRSKSGDPDDE